MSGGGAHAPRTGGERDHREREKGHIVYPVYSRRSGGLSLGVNLFPGQKTCNFNCPYCEVFDFKTDMTFSAGAMEAGLRDAARRAREAGAPVRDICFSGNGEPTASPHFAEALRRAALLREELAPEAALVVISNGTGLLRDGLFNLLRDEARRNPLFDIWLKADAGTEDWYRIINDSAAPYGELMARVGAFCAAAPCSLQTMHCAAYGAAPSEGELLAWAERLASFARAGNVRAAQIYGKARPAPRDPACTPLPRAGLEARAARLREAFRARGITTPVGVYE